jgi:F0F1-type ATP synthase membrane subunit b/b'
MYAEQNFLVVGAVIFLTILGVLWLFLPFAVFGIKNRLDKMIASMSAAAEILAELKGLPARLEASLTAARASAGGAHNSERDAGSILFELQKMNAVLQDLAGIKVEEEPEEPMSKPAK